MIFEGPFATPNGFTGVYMGLQWYRRIYRGIYTRVYRHIYGRHTGIIIVYLGDYMVAYHELYTSLVLKIILFRYYRDEILSMLSQQW